MKEMLYLPVKCTRLKVKRKILFFLITNAANYIIIVPVSISLPVHCQVNPFTPNNVNCNKICN